MQPMKEAWPCCLPICDISGIKHRLRAATFLCLVLVIFLAACSRSKPLLDAEGISSDSNKRVVLFIGDSLTAGYGLDPAQSYPSLIGKYFTDQGLPFQVRNAGISGDTTQGVLTRLDPLLTDDVCFIFLAIGSNDGLRSYPLEEVEKNLREAVTRIQSRGIPLAIAGSNVYLNPRMGYAAGFAKLFPRVAKDLNVPLFPFLLQDVALKADLNLDDRLHPNAKGQQRIAKNVLRFLNAQWEL